MKTVRHIFLMCLIIITLCTSSFFAGFHYHTPEPIVKEVEVIKNVDRIVYRDYTKADCCEMLKEYDTSAMSIKYTVKELKPEYTRLNLSWSLYDRNGFQDVRVPVYQSGNWQMYAGIAVGAVTVGGLAYMLK